MRVQTFQVWTMCLTTNGREMEQQKITTEMIEQRNRTLVLVSDITGISTEEIMSKSRKGEVVIARNLVIWVMCIIYGITTINTGILMHKHYSTIIWAVKEVNYRKDLKPYVRLIKAKINETEIN